MKYRTKIVFLALCTQSMRPISWFSELLAGMPYCTLPQGSALEGRYCSSLTEEGSKREVGIRLFGNG
jgi:hypothetical protein